MHLVLLIFATRTCCRRGTRTGSMHRSGGPFEMISDHGNEEASNCNYYTTMGFNVTSFRDCTPKADGAFYE